ncbi:podocan-like protein 1 [Carlito syrichta]|uniref:Podocan-like protein 1 n=1 Tax=Carlito syrichta TaxID=1868482 RepID=A0A3Q0E5R4_CARSF|nr:podocan-like protein 1 [Carlito syrichta]
MEDATFPHLGESSQPPPRACPPRCSCPRADTVDCDGLELRVFPDNITRAAQHLSLQNNQLQELPYNELSRLSSLRTLNLHNNLISSEGLPDEAFESLTQLQHIYVAHNKLSVAPQFLPRSLRVADLAANQVMEVFPLTFGEKPALRSVYLHNNQLSNAGLPLDAFRGSEAIATLSLSSNRLSYLPPSLPPSLERLHLQHNLISKVPRGALSRQTHLRELYLQHNRLTDSGLDATTFSKLHSLEYLDLSHNQLASVPAGLPRTLAVLHLGRNRIRRVEAARLRGARGLRYLLLQHNPLGGAGLPAGALRPLRRLHTLHLYGGVLDLGHNELSFVPPDLPEALEERHLEGNRIASVGPEAFLSTPRLRALFLRLHRSGIAAEAFLGLAHLRVVDTAGNPEHVLVRLPPTAPRGPRAGGP